MGRRLCCEMEAHEKKRPWTAAEDQKLASFIAKNGFGCWRAVPKPAGLLRCGNSCRLRWINYLRPDLKRRIFSDAEGIVILNLHATLGNRWSLIAAKLPGRTDNEIKNYWSKTLKKTLINQGLDPATHLPLDSTNHSNDSGGDTETAECDEDTDTLLNDTVAIENCSDFIDLEEEPVKVDKDEHSVLPPSPSAVSESQSGRESTDGEPEKSSSTCTNKAFLDRELCRAESPARVVVEVEAKEGLQCARSGSSITDVIANVNHYSPMLLDASNEGSTPFLEEELSWEGLQTLVSYTRLEQSLDLHAQEAGGDYSGVIIPGSSLLHSDISVVWSMDGNIGEYPYPSWNFGSAHLLAAHSSQELHWQAAILDQI